MKDRSYKAVIWRSRSKETAETNSDTWGMSSSVVAFQDSCASTTDGLANASRSKLFEAIPRSLLQKVVVAASLPGMTALGVYAVTTRGDVG